MYFTTIFFTFVVIHKPYDACCNQIMTCFYYIHFMFFFSLIDLLLFLQMTLKFANQAILTSYQTTRQSRCIWIYRITLENDTTLWKASVENRYWTSCIANCIRRMYCLRKFHVSSPFVYACLPTYQPPHVTYPTNTNFHPHPSSVHFLKFSKGSILIFPLSAFLKQTYVWLPSD